MLIDLVLLAVAVVLAGGAYFFKKHTGTLLLLAMAGGLLSAQATASVSTWAKAHGFELQAAPLEGVVAMALVLLPALLGLLVAPKMHAKIRRLVGAIIFGVVTATLLATHADALFDATLIAQSHSVAILKQYQGYVVAGGVMFALLDLVLGKGKPSKEEAKK